MEKAENLEQRALQVVSLLESRESYEQKFDGSLFNLEESAKKLADHNDQLGRQLSDVRDDNDRLSEENQTLNDELKQHSEASAETAAQLAQTKDEIKQLSEALAAVVFAVEKITTATTDDDKLSRVIDLTAAMKANLEHACGASAAAETSDEASVVVETSESATPDEAEDAENETVSNVATIEFSKSRKQISKSKPAPRNRMWKAAL